MVGSLSRTSERPPSDQGFMLTNGYGESRCEEGDQGGGRKLVMGGDGGVSARLGNVIAGADGSSAWEWWILYLMPEASKVESTG